MAHLDRTSPNLAIVAMQEDEIQQDGAEENTAEVSETTEETTQEEAPVVEEKVEEQVDYRGKLNATNNFLKKEGYEFKDGKWVPPTKSRAETTSESPMSLADAAALLKADVHEDDVERVEKYAKAEGVSVREALKNDELKAILAVRSEKRSTANAANISNVRRGPTKVSDDVLISNAEKGRLPDDDEGIERLIAAKTKQK